MLGLYMMALGILYPVGAITQGSIANVVGIRAVTVGGAVALLHVTLLAFRRQILERPAPSGEGDLDTAVQIGQNVP
jgi:hypothetical protein